MYILQIDYISPLNLKLNNMKNILRVFAITGLLVLGGQSMSAQSLSQDQNRPEAIAKTETAKLSETLGLNGDQTRAVFRALVAKEVGYLKYVEGKELSSAPAVAEKAKLDETLNAQMKKTLTAEQYTNWVKSLDN